MLPPGSFRCPTVGQNFLGRKNSRKIKDVKSWGECAAKCRATTTCRAWVWHHEDAGSWRYQCLVMDGYSKYKRDKNTIVGLRDCYETGTTQYAQTSVLTNCTRSAIIQKT